MALNGPYRVALIALGATIVAGQSVFTGINSCGASCVNTALSNDNCSNDFSDISCICSSSQFANNGPFSCCVIKNCASSLDAIEAQAYAYGYCLAYHAIPSSPACPTATLSSSYGYSGLDLPTGLSYPYSTGGAIPSFSGAAFPSISGSFSSGQDASGTASSSSGGGGISTGAIVGIVVGVLGGLALIGGIIILCLFRKRQRNRKAQAQPYPNAGQQGPPQPIQSQQQAPMMQQQQQPPPYGQQQQPYGGPQQGPFVGGYAPVPQGNQQLQPQQQQQGQYQTVTGPGYHEADSRTMASNAPTSSASPNTTGFSSPSNAYVSPYGPPSAQDPRAPPFDSGGGVVHEAPGANAAAQTYAPYKPQEGGGLQQAGYSTYSPMQEMPGNTQQR